METGECEDINECDTGEANCSVENQACMNTIGSYKCLDIIVNDKQNNCEDGYRYQARIDQCVGESKNLFIHHTHHHHPYYLSYNFILNFDLLKISMNARRV